MDVILWGLLAVIAIIAVYVIGVYNTLVALRVKVEEAWSSIDTQLKKRYDLIPNLVETVKGYAGHEKEVFENVTKARSQAMQAGTPEEQAQAENFLTQTLKSLFAVSENYPQLRANENFMQLQQTLNQVENDIQRYREFYNNVVRQYQTKLQSFPDNIIAGMFNFQGKEFFETDNPEERQNVKVQF